MKNITPALQNVNSAIQINPKYADAYIVRSKIYNDQMKNAEAINDISTVILLQPDNEEMYFIRGKYYQDFAQHVYAINDFSKVISLNPDRADAYFNRAHSYEQTMNFQAAIRDFETLKRFGGDTGDVTALLHDAEKRLFELNRETNKPIIKLTEPEEKPQRMVMVPRNKDSFNLTGKIVDQSPIKSLSVNGNPVQVSKKGEDFEFFADVNLSSDQIVVEASDIYDNIEIAYYQVIRTETDPPKVRIIAPYASDNNQIYLDSNDPTIYVEGSITDESHITSIFIDGVMASYIPQDINPTFQANINIRNKDRFTVTAQDNFGNVSETVFNINREGAEFAAENPMGKTWVVFIENSNYQNFASLEGPVKDVTLMKTALARYTVHNFIHKKDMTKQDLEKFFAIELRDLIRSNRVNSIMIWFAGHGKFVNETGYWVPIDAKRDDEFTYYNINALRASMQSYPNTIKHTLVITDACESGPSFYQAMRTELQIRSCNDPVATRMKSAQVFSSAGYELAVDNSQFTRTFANVLMNSQDACVPIESIVQKVTTAVVNNSQQKPQFGKISGLEDEDGTFFFISR
jgi:Tfp pilus assembly protein PilF